jgi:hypothetical protein
MPSIKKNSSQAAKKPKANGLHPTSEEIALRAYQIYLERGGAPGNALEDWTQAERELIEKTSKPRRKAAPKRIAA